MTQIIKKYIKKLLSKIKKYILYKIAKNTLILKKHYNFIIWKLHKNNFIKRISQN